MVVVILIVLLFMLNGDVGFKGVDVGFVDGCFVMIVLFYMLMVLVVVWSVEWMVDVFYVGFFCFMRVIMLVMCGVVIFVFDIIVKFFFVIVLYELLEFWSGIFSDELLLIFCFEFK